MSLSIYQYALILLSSLTILYLLRWLLELRFHLHISRVGFFSVTGIRYHQGSDSKRKWSINVGKIKTRLKHSTDIASSAWITIHLSDIEIAINNLDTLIAERRRRHRQQQQKRPSNINRRLSNMGDSLKRIPWWYSLSVVKYILKFTSALPAQFVMAGLANYVDVQIDGLTVSLDNVGHICIEQLNFSSILFAAMSRVPPSSSIPAASTAAAAFATTTSSSFTTTMPAEPHFTSDSGAENDGFHARRQRHSLKRAEHLFKEKFFEITVQVGHIGFRGADKSTEIWGLPMGSRVAISCHLSAGCLTLKDVDMTIQVDAIQIKLDQLSQLARTIRQQVPMEATTATTTTSTGNSPKHPSPPKKSSAASVLHLIRTLSISISDIALTCETTEGLYTSVRLHSLVLSLAAQVVDSSRARDRAALYVIQGDVDLITWSIFNNKPDLATECIEPVHVPKTKISATITEAMLLGSEHSLDQDSNKRRRTSGPGMLLSSMALEQVVGNNTLTQRFLRVSVTIRDPKFTVDVDKKQLLDSLLRKRSNNSSNNGDDDEKSNTASDPRSQSLSDMKENRWMNKRVLGELPRVLFAVNIERPLLDFCNSAVKANGHGLITTTGMSFEFSGEYIPRTPSIASPPPSPSYDELDEGMRKRRQPKSWVKLFRKSWKPKNPLPQTSLETDWNYHIRAAVKVDSIAVRHGRTVNAISIKENPLAGLESIDVTARTQLLAEPSSNVQDSGMAVTWDWENQQNDAELSIGSPYLNLSSVTVEGQKTIDFWMERVIRPLGVKHVPKERTTSVTTSKFDESTFANHIKTTVVVNNLSITLAGVDQGVKGKREAPKQHMDNAPTVDTVVHFHLQLETFSIGFTGAAFARSHRRSASSDSSKDKDDIASRSRLGKIRGHAYQLTIKKRFQMGTECEDVSRLLFWCSHINMATDVALEGWQICLSPAIVAKKCGFVYGIDAHYAVLVILQEAKNIKNMISRKELVPEPSQQLEQQPQQQEVKSSTKVSLLKVQLQVNRTDVSFTLPSETKLYLRMDEIRSQHQGGTDVNDTKQEPIVAARNIMLFGLSPVQASKWEQLIELDNIGFSRVHDQGQMINQLAMSKLFLRVPYKFEVSNIVDNAVTFTKGLKAMHGRFSGAHPFTYLGPSVSPGPRKVPNICLKCGTLRLQFDDDPFEARLRMIWRTGLTEQINRLALDEAFEAKAQTIMHTPNVKDTSRKGIDNDQARNRFLSADQAKASSTSSGTNGENVPAGDESDESADAHVNEVWQMLQEHNSATWIKHINAAILQEENDHDKSRISDYSRLGQLNDVYDDDGQNDVASLFFIETLPLPPHPPLFDFTIMNMTLHVSLPDFPLEDTRLFVHQNGKGIPIDTEFTTLMPFRLDWKAGETWAQIRDYPLPMLLVPPPKDGSKVSWSLLGNYVLGDELGSLDATRRITIPITHTPNYTMDIARTSSPAKFYSIVNINVHTPDMSTISWSVPYQPAIQDISRTFDSFTRPPVDPSPKIGFWDKIRLIIHTKTKISFVGGGDFAFLMKGTRDPYETSERGFGLAKVWSNDVVWLLGHDNPDREFLQIISRDYAFGVPDLIHGGYTSTYILPGIVRPTDSDSQENQGDDELCAPKRTRTLTSLLTERRSDPRFVKVALKLTDGIRMGIGCQLERVCPPGCPKCDNNDDIKRVSMYTRSDMTRCRCLTFLPHYEVRMKTPRAVQAMGEKAKNYDAYEGFRSNFIHLSISIVKISAEKPDKVDITNATMNSMHLTPGFIDHFVTWFRLFGGAMSYPMRNGALFPRTDPRPTKKFGKHMRSMKYKVMLHPLTIGYFYKDQNAVDDKRLEETGDSVGLKALVSAFNVDIHQRREITDVENHKLDQKRLKANWPMHEAEVHLKSIDLRAVRARYSTSGESSQHSVPSVAVGGLSESSDSSSADPDLMDGLDRDENEDAEPSDWVDFDDFVELQVLSPDNAPIVQVLPFAYSPCLYYLKQTNRADREKYRYLRNTHNCIMGTAGDTREIQMGIVRQRCQNIDVQIKKHQARIHTVESKLSEQDDQKLLNESRAMVKKTELLFEKRALLQRYLRELSTQAMPNVSGGNSISDQASYSSSALFTHDSLSVWEDLMGHFKQRCIVHNPQIIWNNAVRNIVYHFLDVRAHRRALDYYTSMRAVKFLRDLIENSQKERELWKRDSVVMNDDGDTNFDSRMAEELIQKLLAEQHTKFVALNETEEDLEKNKTVDMDMPTGKVNDPETQRNSIPSGYEMKSSYLIDLLHPQISLQSDRDPDSLVIVANERIQVKGFNIFDVNGADVEETDLVKNRTIVSLDNSQVFVAKKERFDTVDLLFDNHYGAKHTDRWLAWVPPEMLINYTKQSDKFQRVAHRLEATVQYDKYNQLRFKTNPTAFAHIHPFEDRCDNVHLNIPELSLNANSSQYNAIFEVVTDLLLYKEPAKKERLARLREIMMAADRNSIDKAIDRIITLQDRVRQLNHTYTQYRLNLSHLDQSRVDEFRAIRASKYEHCEELYLGMEAIKLTQQSNTRKNYHEPKTNLKFVFVAEKLLWEMLTDNDAPLCEWNLVNTTYILTSKEDRSSSNTFEVDMLTVKNKTSSPVFTEVLGPYVDPKRTTDFSRHKMLRGYLVDLPPVGGIPVTQHLEVNLYPLRLQMTYEFGKAMASYVFPAERRQKPSSTDASSAPRSPVSPSNGDGEGSSIHHSISSNDIRLLDEPEIVVPTEAQEQAPEMTTSLSAPPSGKKGLKNGKRKQAKKSVVDDLSVMKKRASTNRAFLLVKIPGTRHCLSYQGPKEKNIEDLRDFAFQQPNLEYRNKTWSWFELMSIIKKDFMRAAVLHNSTALLKEKLMIRRHPPREKLAESNISIQSNASHIASDAYAFPDDASESTDSSNDELDELENDAISLRSVSLWEVDQGGTEPANHTHTTRRLLPWSLRSRKRQVVDSGHLHDDIRTEKRHSIDSMEGRETSSMLDEELTAKGRMLLGKKYNGPIYSFATKPSSKRKRPTTHRTES